MEGIVEGTVDPKLQMMQNAGEDSQRRPDDVECAGYQKYPEDASQNFVCPAAGKMISTYTKVMAVLQGFVTVFNINIAFVMSAMVPKVLEVEPFGYLISLVINAFSLTTNFLFFLSNPLKPYATVSGSFMQGIFSALLIVVISFSSGKTGKILYLVVTAFLGVVLGLNNITSFALAACAPVSCIGFLSFGYSLGGLTSFVLSNLFGFVIGAKETKKSIYTTMLYILVVATVIPLINGLNLLFYLGRKSIKEHFRRSKLDGAGSAACSIRNAFKGFKYCWKLLLIEAVGLINYLMFYPGIAPGSWTKNTISERVQLIGTSQISETVGRGLAIFIRPEYLISNVNSVIILVCSVFLISIYFIVVTVFQNMFILSSYTCKVISFILFATINGYCLSFSDKNISTTIPQTLDNDVKTSTTVAFGVAISFFCTIGSLIGTGLLQLLV